MTDTNMSIHKVTELPATLEKNALYLLKPNNDTSGNLSCDDLYANEIPYFNINITDLNGTDTYLHYNTDAIMSTINSELETYRERYPTISGPTSVVSRSFGIYTITNFDIDTTYNVTSDLGTIEFLNLFTFKYFPDPSIESGLGNIIINNRTIDITITERSMNPNPPIILTPTNNAIEVIIDHTVIISAFSSELVTATHAKTIWEIATSSDFSTSSIVGTVSSDDSGNLLQCQMFNIRKTDEDNNIVITDSLSPETNYHIRCRWFDDGNRVSDWSNIISFTTKSLSVPTTETGILIASNRYMYDNYGWDVEMTGNGSRVFVSAYNKSYESLNLWEIGTVYVYRREPTGWTEEAIIYPDTLVDGEMFGHSLSIDNTGTRFISFHFSSQYGTPGNIYVYKRTGTIWEMETRIPADGWGNSPPAVAMDSDGKTIVFTVYDSDVELPYSTLLIYKRTDTTWSLDYSETDNVNFIKTFISGDGLTVIATHSLNNQYDQDMTLYKYKNGSWIKEFTLLYDTNGVTINFTSIAINETGTCFLIGDDDNEQVYIYAYNGTSWNLESTIDSVEPELGNYFGYSVAMNKNGTVLGVGDITNGGSGNGAVFIFSRDGADITYKHKLKASNLEGRDYFGNSLSFDDSGSKVIIAAYYKDVYPDPNAWSGGSVYIFE